MHFGGEGGGLGREGEGGLDFISQKLFTQFDLDLLKYL